MFGLRNFFKKVSYTCKYIYDDIAVLWIAKSIMTIFTLILS